MNETLKTIAQRYSCRAYDGRSVERGLLDAIALAAVQSPSGMNSQPWRINVVTDKAFIEEMDAEGMRLLAENPDSKSTYERMMNRGGTLFYNAPCMFVILKNTGGGDDIGIVSQNIALAASSLGLGNVICGMAGVPLRGPKGESFKKRAGIEDGWSFGMAVLVGYASKPGTPHEPDLNKVKFI